MQGSYRPFILECVGVVIWFCMELTRYLLQDMETDFISILRIFCNHSFISRSCFWYLLFPKQIGFLFYKKVVLRILLPLPL